MFGFSVTDRSAAYFDRFGGYTMWIISMILFVALVVFQVRAWKDARRSVETVESLIKNELTV